MWHKMSLIGKVLILLVGFGFGLATGFYYGESQIINEGNKVTVEFDGKVKKGSEVNINLEDIDQEQEAEQPRKKKWFNK